MRFEQADARHSSRTSLALSNLRGVIIVLIVAFHSFAAYIVSQPPGPATFNEPPYAWVAIPIMDPNRWIGFDLICAFLFLYLMQLMFFLSGVFVWPSLSRRGRAPFMVRRVYRLGVPFVMGIYLLMPVTYYAAYRTMGVDREWSAYWAQWKALQIWPTGQMWFLWLLLVLDIAATVLLVPLTVDFVTAKIGKIVVEPRWLFIVLICASAAMFVPLAAIYTPWQWIGFGPFKIQAAFAPQYALYFAWGVGVGICGLERGPLNADGELVQRWPYWVFGSIAAFMIWISPTALLVSGNDRLAGLQIAADFGLVLFVGSACFAMLAVSLRFATNRWPAIDAISENAYGIYFFHYTLTVWLQYALLDRSFPAIAKGLVVFIGSLLLSLAASVLTYQTTSTAVLLVDRVRRWVLK